MGEETAQIIDQENSQKTNISFMGSLKKSVGKK